MHENKTAVIISANPYTTHSVFIGYLAWVFGVAGAHRFYFGKRLTGLLWLCTGGLFLIGWIIDFFFIPSMAEEASRKYRHGNVDYTVAWLLHSLLGVFGGHRFYMGKTLTGLIWLCTGGLLLIGWLYDWLTLNEQVSEVNAEFQARLGK